MRVEVLVLSIAAGAFAQKTAPDDSICRAEDQIVVATTSRTLSLCEDGKVRARYRVAIGSGGVGKTRQGDRRTPIGLYPLGAPRRSNNYGVFVPVGYPTQAQARAGFTGDGVGVHGPPRELASAGVLNVAADWTAGCVAVSSDREIGEIAGWVRGRPHPTIRIE
jgi:murein L,D-transpeptidase YafK